MNITEAYLPITTNIRLTIKIFNTKLVYSSGARDYVNFIGGNRNSRCVLLQKGELQKFLVKIMLELQRTTTGRFARRKLTNQFTHIGRAFQQTCMDGASGAGVGRLCRIVYEILFGYLKEEIYAIYIFIEPTFFYNLLHFPG